MERCTERTCIYAIGVVNGLEITVIDTDRDEGKRRIISAWRSEPHERRAYWRSIKEQSQMKMRANVTTTKKRRGTKRRGATDWSRLRRGTPAEIRKGIGADPEAHATDAQFWKTAKVVLPTPKEIVTMRLDADLLQWFRRERGYQTRINAILRAYMEAHESA